ncbi:MAG: hypothetical protein J6W09_04530 [Bacteroidales bacterium]|nr:hypothetical protein [Bacteroidales bacterium]
MSRYDYKTLRDAALRPNATKLDRLALGEWMDRFCSSAWNGECYDIDDGRTLWPVYEVVDDAGYMELIDYDVR